MAKGMRPAQIMAPIFASHDPKQIEFSRLALKAGVIGLMLQDCVWLNLYPNTPPIYQAGVIYKPERRQVDVNGNVLEYGEAWQTIPYVIHHGYGDCEDLGAWRAAELRMKGIAATPEIKIRKLPSGHWRAHVVVKWPNGKIEDPSAKLGMYAYGRQD